MEDYKRSSHGGVSICGHEDIG